MTDKKSIRIRHTHEFYVSTWSKAIGRTLESLMKEYKVQFIQTVSETERSLNPASTVQAGMYLRVTGEWDQVSKFVEYADMPEKRI
jgi:hypothetical protein